MILATNTTACPITEIKQQQSTATGYRNALLQPSGNHEARRDHARAADVEGDCGKTKELAEFLGKTPVTIKIETPAGIVSRILGALLNEAVVAYSEGVAEPQDIDTAMKLGANLPMGPPELIDMIGVDVHSPRWRPFRELETCVTARPTYLKDGARRVSGAQERQGFLHIRTVTS